MSRLGWSASALCRCDNLFSFSLLRGSSALAVVVRFQSFPLLGAPQHLLWSSASQHLLWSSVAFSTSPQHFVVFLVGLSLDGALVRDF